MPLTPFHLGPALLLGLLLGLNLPVALVASVLPDLEALYLLLSNTGGSLLKIPFSENPKVEALYNSLSDAGDHHGFFHSYFGATVISLALGLVWKKERVFASALVGASSHVFLDSIHHRDVEPFWPAASNPFMGMLGSLEVYAVSAISLIAGILLLHAKWIGRKQ